MVIRDTHAKRIEKKFPNLITEDPWSIEFDKNDYRLEQFKKKAPEKYVPHRERILGDLDSLRVDMNFWFEQNKKRNGHH
jgi:hypothetical protein